MPNRKFVKAPNDSVRNFTGVSTTTWYKQNVERLIGLAQDQEWETFGGNYGGKESKLLYDTILSGNVDVNQKNVLVIGSIEPWVESIFLSLGANHTTTLEYNKIVSDHPRVGLTIYLLRLR